MKYLVLIGVAFNLAGCMDLFHCKQRLRAGGMEFCIQYKIDVELDMENVELVVQVVEEESQAYYPQVVDFKNKLELGGTEVYVVNKNKTLVRKCDPSPVPTVHVCKERLGGINSVGSRMVIMGSRIDGCINYQVLAHELLHSVQFFYAIDLFESHETPHFFKQTYEGDPEAQRDTIEYKTEQRLKRSCKYETD